MQIVQNKQNDLFTFCLLHSRGVWHIEEQIFNTIHILKLN